jgi:hypothetical protein
MNAERDFEPDCEKAPKKESWGKPAFALLLTEA